MNVEDKYSYELWKKRNRSQSTDERDVAMLEEELRYTRNINDHLNNVLDKQKNQLDGIRNIIREVCTGKITEEMGMDDVTAKMEWRR